MIYSPYQSCVLISHENISCLTEAGVGANLAWQVRLIAFLSCMPKPALCFRLCTFIGPLKR
jgi:hypothetical protein